MNRAIEVLEAEEAMLVASLDQVRVVLKQIRDADVPSPTPLVNGIEESLLVHPQAKKIIAGLRTYQYKPKRKLSAAGRKAIAAAAKRRWAKHRREKKAAGR